MAGDKKCQCGGSLSEEFVQVPDGSNTKTFGRPCIDCGLVYDANGFGVVEKKVNFLYKKETDKVIAVMQ